METKNLKIFSPTDFESDTLSVNIDLDDYFALKQWQSRILDLNDRIDEVSASSIVGTIIYINMLDKGIPVEDRVPIKLFISSEGGDVMDGFSIIDAIQNSITPIYIINRSYQYSMAALIGVVGHKRYATKNATFLFHDGTMFIGDSSGKAHDFLKFDLQIKDRIKELVLSHTNITSRTYNKKVREEWYFFADEAKRLGVIDGIIGEDVTLEEII